MGTNAAAMSPPMAMAIDREAGGADLVGDERLDIGGVESESDHRDEDHHRDEHRREPAQAAVEPRGQVELPARRRPMNSCAAPCGQICEQ